MYRLKKYVAGYANPVINKLAFLQQSLILILIWCVSKKTFPQITENKIKTMYPHNKYKSRYANAQASKETGSQRVFLKSEN